jgi:hypothetical protein
MSFLKRLFGSATDAAPAPAPAERVQVDLRGELPPDAFLCPQGQGGELYSVSVAGESFYRAAIERAVRRRPEGHRTIIHAALVWEPNNKYDSNAIAVQLGGATCGHFPREEARAYRPVMERLVALRKTAYARADIRGGWQDADGSWADFGTEIRLAKPEALLEALASERGTG